ncbi:MAG TPA: hypothetical protein VK081_13790, partial [Planctomycetota bacterium]|nr:hypothetical protein [Planctomycetota bacterium]
MAVCPILVGRGLPFLAGAARRHALRLQDQRVYPKSGI